MSKTKQGDLVGKENGRELLKNVRLSFAYLFKPDVQTNEAGVETKSYRVALLLPKATHRPVAAKLKKKIDELIVAEYDKGTRIPPDRICLRDGDQTDVPEHHGHWVLSVREARRPTLVDRKKQPVVEEDELLYAGAWANVVIRLWAQNGKSMKKHNKYGKRINCGFDIVQFVDHDDPFSGGGRPDVDAVLDELDDDFPDDDNDDNDGLDGL